jgi:hypothetical protein
MWIVVVLKEAAQEVGPGDCSENHLRKFPAKSPDFFNFLTDQHVQAERSYSRVGLTSNQGISHADTANKIVVRQGLVPPFTVSSACVFNVCSRSNPFVNSKAFDNTKCTYRFQSN